MNKTDDEKPYQLTFEDREEYLYAVVLGEEDSFEISAAYWREIGTKLNALGKRKVLVVEDLAGESPIVDVYNVSAEIIHMGFQGKVVAFVDRHSDHSDLNEFGALVGTNRGLVGRTFQFEEDAEEWLLSK